MSANLGARNSVSNDSHRCSNCALVFSFFIALENFFDDSSERNVCRKLCRDAEMKWKELSVARRAECLFIQRVHPMRASLSAWNCGIIGLVWRDNMLEYDKRKREHVFGKRLCETLAQLPFSHHRANLRKLNYVMREERRVKACHDVFERGAIVCGVTDYGGRHSSYHFLSTRTPNTYLLAVRLDSAAEPLDIIGYLEYNSLGRKLAWHVHAPFFRAFTREDQMPVRPFGHYRDKSSIESRRADSSK